MTQSTKKPVTVSRWFWLEFFDKQVHFSKRAKTAANGESKLSSKTLLKFLKAWIDLLSLQSNESYSTLLVCSSSHSQIVSCLVRLSLFCEAFFSCNRIIKHSVDYCVVIFHLKHVFTCRIICKFNVNFISCCSKRSLCPLCKSKHWKMRYNTSDSFSATDSQLQQMACWCLDLLSLLYKSWSDGWCIRNVFLSYSTWNDAGIKTNASLAISSNDKCDG